MSVSDTLLNDYKINICFRMDENLRMVDLALKKVDDSELWQKPNSKLNSIGNLILHLCGNIVQYIHSGIGGLEDVRQRDAEFDTHHEIGKSQLLARLNKTVSEAKEYVHLTELDAYLRIREIQGFKLSGLGAVLHVVEHFSYHTGQIAFWVKYLKDEDLKYYDNLDLNILNQ